MREIGAVAEDEAGEKRLARRPVWEDEWVGVGVEAEGLLWNVSMAMWLVNGGQGSLWKIPRELMIPARVVSWQPFKENFQVASGPVWSMCLAMFSRISPTRLPIPSIRYSRFLEYPANHSSTAIFSMLLRSSLSLNSLGSGTVGPCARRELLVSRIPTSAGWLWTATGFWSGMYFWILLLMYCISGLSSQTLEAIFENALWSMPNRLQPKVFGNN